MSDKHRHRLVLLAVFVAVVAGILLFFGLLAWATASLGN